MSDEADIIKLNASLEQDAANKILDLNKQIDVEKSKGRGTNQGIITELEKQKQQVTDNLAITKQLKLEELDKLRILQEQRSAYNYHTEAFAQQNNSMQKGIDLLTQMDVVNGKITDEQASRIMKLGALETDYANKRMALLNQLETATTQIDKDILNAKIFDLKRLEGEQKSQLRRSIELEDEKRDSTIAGVKSAMDQIEKSMDPFNLAQQATLGLFGKINDSIRELVTTGKTSFGDLAKSFGQMILEMMLKQQVAKAASAATGWLDALFSNLFKAEGGPVKGGQPYIVGEKGPELFVPPSAGSIIPNNKMASATPTSSGASTASNTYITNNISAIDAKSVAQLFAENRRVLFGSVQMAQKELSYGR
jgi:lambda family phage tail tape measure protein